MYNINPKFTKNEFSLVIQKDFPFLNTFHFFFNGCFAMQTRSVSSLVSAGLFGTAVLVEIFTCSSSFVKVHSGRRGPPGMLFPSFIKSVSSCILSSVAVVPLCLYTLNMPLVYSLVAASGYFVGNTSLYLLGFLIAQPSHP